MRFRSSTNISLLMFVFIFLFVCYCREESKTHINESYLTSIGLRKVSCRHHFLIKDIRNKILLKMLLYFSLVLHRLKYLKIKITWVYFLCSKSRLNSFYQNFRKQLIQLDLWYILCRIYNLII